MENESNKKAVERALKRVKRRILALDAARGIALLAGYIILFLLLEMVCDTIFALPRHVRMYLLTALEVSSLLIFAILVVLPCVRKINDAYAAKIIERAFPELRGCLTALVDAESAGEWDADLLESLRERAANQLPRLPIERAVPTTRFGRSVAILLAAIVAAFGYSALAGKSSLVSLERSIAPSRDIPPLRKTTIVRVEPSAAARPPLENSPVKIRATIRGERPERVVLEWTRDGDRWFKTEMTELASGRWTCTIPDIGKGIEYFVRAGDAKSETHRLATVPPPAIQSITVRYVYPSELNRKPREDNSPHIRAPAGTIVRLTARTNRPIRKATLVLNGKSIPMKVQRGGRELTAEFKVTESGGYHINLVSVDGYSNQNPPEYEIVCLPPGTGALASKSRKPTQPSPTALKKTHLQLLSEPNKAREFEKLLKQNEKIWLKLARHFANVQAAKPRERGSEKQPAKGSGRGGTSSAPTSTARKTGGSQATSRAPEQVASSERGSKASASFKGVGESEKGTTSAPGGAPAHGAPAGRGESKTLAEAPITIEKALDILLRLQGTLSSGGVEPTLAKAVGMIPLQLRQFAAKYTDLLGATEITAEAMRARRGGAPTPASPGNTKQLTVSGKQLPDLAPTGIKSYEARISPSYRELVEAYFQALAAGE